MFEMLQGQLLAGPNIHAPRSVLLCTLRFTADAAALLAAPARFPGGLAQVAGAEPLVEIARAAHASLSPGQLAIHLLPEIAARVQAPYVVEQAEGRLLHAQGDTIGAIIAAEDEMLGREACRLACAMLLAMQGSEEAAAGLAQRWRAFEDLAPARGHDQFTLAVIRAAARLDIPAWQPDREERSIQLGQGRYRQRCFETRPDRTGNLALFTSTNKHLTLNRLRQMGLPTLPSAVARSEDEAIKIAAGIGRPVVVKPMDQGGGRGIGIDLATPDAVRAAYRRAAEYCADVLVERYAPADDHRLLVVGGKLIAAARRTPAHVTGDGHSTVAELVDRLNADPRRGRSYSSVMQQVALDAAALGVLAREGLDAQSVPEAGRMVKLTLAGNISQGGTAEDVLAIVHPDNRAAAERAARMVGLDVAGVDFQSCDISRSWRDGDGWILELNAPPGLRPHWLANPAQDVVTPVVRVMFPEGAPARIPTIGVTGSLGKTTTCQMLARMARAAGHVPGLTTTQGIWSGDFQVAEGDCAGGPSAARIMTDPDIDFGIFELARGGLLKRGMMIDGVDVAAVLNVADNHLNLDGVQTLEQMAAIKALVPRNARAAVLLNADDPLALAMRGQTRAPRIALASTDPASAALAEHRAQGHCTVTLTGHGEEEAIRLDDGGETRLLLPVSAIPASLGGRARPIVVNALYAVGAAWLAGLPGAAIEQGLRGFTSSVAQNPGRHNRIDGLPFALTLDWADNATALREVLARLSGEPPARVRHLWLTVPGNRPDEWITAMGRAASAAGFEHYHCADMANLRGRQPGEAANLLAQGLREAGVAADAITCRDSAALPTVLGEVRSGERLAILDYELPKVFAAIAACHRGA